MAAAWLSCGTLLYAADDVATAAAKPVTVLLDDVPMTFDGVAATITSDITFVPFRAIAEAMDITVEWTAATKTITAKGTVDGQPRTVVLQVGKTTATVDGKSAKLIAAPYVKNGWTLIPLSFFSTSFGAQVGWNGTTRTVSIVSPAREMHLRGFYALGAFGERDRIAGLDSVAFGWIRVDENGEMTTSGKEYYWPQPAGEITPESLVTDVNAEGKDSYLMVYSVDGKGELTKMLSDAGLRDKSIGTIVSLAKEKSFGGVLLDFEGLGLKLDPKAQAQLLNDYVKILSEKLKAEGIKLSLAVPPPNSAFKGYDHLALSKMADDLVIMAYEYHPAGTPDHTPQPNSLVQAAIASLLKLGVPKEKLLLGVDLWSETPASIDDKLGLAKRYDLKGAAFWRIGLYFHYGQEMTDAIDRSVRKEGE